MTPRIIIPAAGGAARWGTYLGVPKQLAPVAGVPLIHRTIGQLVALGLTDIVVVTRDSRMVAQPARLLRPTKSALPGSGIGQSAEAWAKDRDNAVLLGDVYWTDAALSVLTWLTWEKVVFWGRSLRVGKHNPEIFGVLVPVAEQERFLNAMKFVRFNRPGGKFRLSDGWMIYRHLQGLPIKEEIFTGPRLIDLQDDTTDIDHPSEYEELVGKVGK